MLNVPCSPHIFTKDSYNPLSTAVLCQLELNIKT